MTVRNIQEFFRNTATSHKHRRDEGMEFPVDVLEAKSHGELERSARTYMNELLYADPDHAHYFTLPGGKKVQISLSSVGFVPLYGANLQHKVLALFTPQDQLTAVALFLDSQWYSVEDTLKTANSRREGLIKVRSVGERIVLYVLNRVVYRTKEMERGEMPFLCHGENEHAKIFWKNGQAVGFYSVKPKGSVCNNSLRQCYFLPVMDSIFVRKTHRGKGYGLQMLEDFVDSFNEDELGLKYPLTPAMTNVCRHYLDRYPADVDLLWEVEGIGGPYQRTTVAYKLTTRPLNAHTHKGGHAEDNGQNGDIVEDHVEESEETSLNITEEVIVVNKHHEVTEETDTPVSTRTRSSEHNRRKRVREEEEAKGVDSRPDKINRLEVPEEEEKEIVPDDGVVVEPALESPTETATVEVNSKQAEEKMAKEGAEEEDESSIQNGSARKEQGVMEVDGVAEKHKALVRKDDTQTVGSSEEPAAEQEEEAPVAEDNQEMEVGTIGHVQQKEQDDPAAEEDSFAENEQNEVDAQVAPAGKNQDLVPGARKDLEVAPAAEEKRDAAPTEREEQDASPAAEDEQDLAATATENQEVVPPPKKEQCPANEEEETSEEEQDAAPAAKEKQDEAVVDMEEQEGGLSVEEEQEVASEIENNVEEETKVAPETKDTEVATVIEETSPLGTDSEGEKGQDESMDVMNDIVMTDTSEESFNKEGMQPSEEKENSPLLAEEEEEGTQKDDEMDDEGEDKNLSDASDFSKVARGARTRTVPPTSKRSSKRLSKVAPDDDEEEQERESKAVEDDKGMSTEDEKLTTEEEEAEHSSDDDEQVHDPPVIDKRVLRRKTKVVQTKQRTRSKRRGKM